MPIEFRILGPLEVSADGRVLPLGSPKQRALLGLLLVRANETVSRDRLIEELWGDAAPATVESALQVHLSRLRKLLEPAGVKDALVHEAWGYRLAVGPEELDLDRFERLVGEGRDALAAGEPGLAAQCFRDGLALWRGPALADLQSERFAIDAAARLDEERVAALEQRLEADLALGRDQELVVELEALVAEHPYRERLRSQLMLALYRSGRQVEALEAYRQARQTLAAELGLEPGQELKQLERAILANDPSLIVRTPTEPQLESPPQVPSRAAAPSLAEERKVVTVVVGELVEKDERVERDPEDVLALQQRFWDLIQPAIEQHGGRLEERAGGTVMAFFGVPRVHGDDAERAVRAALVVRDEAAREGLDVRTIVLTGEALVRVQTVPAGESVATTGALVDTAAHLCSAVPPSTVLVGERTYRATRQRIDYSDARPLEVGAMRLWDARATTSAPKDRSGVRLRTPLVGRERELGLLVAAFARVCEQGEPELVTLFGAPGIGKTRLVDELRSAAEADRAESIAWLQGRSLPYGDGSFWAPSELVKAHLGVLEVDTVEDVERKLVAAVRGVLRDGHEAEWVERELRPLLGLTGGGTAAGRDRAETFAAWRRFFEALAEIRPLVLVFEDLHWADESLLDFVDGLAEWISGVPLLIVATARPELLDRRPHWGGGKTNAFTLSLEPLSDEESERLLVALSHQLPTAEDRRLLEKIGGNPFFAEQYALALDEGVQTGELPLPESVQAMIAARLDALPPAEKSLLQDAAVVGKVFWAGAATALEDLDRSAADAQLRALEHKQFLQRAAHSAVAGESEYSFRHVLLRDVVYAEIPRAARARKHQRAAAWIEALARPQEHAETLAHHYGCALELTAAAGGDTLELEQRARRVFRDAADRALTLNAAQAAARYYERALELWPEHDPDRPQLLFRYASALHITGDPRQEEILTRARELLLAAGDVETAAQADALLADMCFDTAGREGVESHLDQAEALMRERPASVAKAHVLADVSRLRWIALNESAEAIRTGREALAIAETLRLPAIEADVLITIGMSRFNTGDPAGTGDVERGLELALAHNALRAAARGYNNLAAVATDTGALAQREELLTASQLLHQRLGDTQRIRQLTVSKLATTALWRADWDEALPLADAFIAECEAGAPHAAEGLARVARATIRLARDDTAGAIHDYELAVAHTQQAHADVAYNVLAASAWIAFELGRFDEARARTDEAIALNLPYVPQTGLALAFGAEKIGRRAEIKALFARVPPDNPWRRAAELMLDGRLDQAADTCADIRAAAYEAHARLRAGTVLAKEIRHAEAKAQLDRALAFYRSVGATRYIQQAKTLLAFVEADRDSSERAAPHYAGWRPEPRLTRRPDG